MIEVNHVSLTYVQENISTEALSQVNLNIARGESLVLIGPSGCGKSSLLFLLAGLRHPTSGKVSIDGAEILKPRTKTALILQDYGLFPWKTVWENAALGLKLRGTKAPDLANTVTPILQELGLWEHRHHYPTQLSGGQRQRVAVARALALNPDLLNKPVLPTPWTALMKFKELWAQSLWQHFGVSAWRIAASLVISMVTAVPLGLFLGRSPKADRLAAPLVYLLYPIPKSVFLPIIIIFLGLGDTPKIFLITIILFFQILVAARDAAKGAAQQSIYSLQSLGANSWQIYRHVIWPSTLPDILTSLRISIGTAIAVLFLAESFASEKGLGYLIMSAWGRQEPGEMFAAIMGMAILGFGAYILVDLLERTWCKWQRL